MAIKHTNLPAVNGDDTLSCSSPSFSEMNITHVMKCQLQCGPVLDRSTTTPTRATPLSSAFVMLTSVKACQPEGGADLERDSRVTSTTVAPQSSDSERNISRDCTSQSQGGGPDLGWRMATPTLGDSSSAFYWHSKQICGPPLCPIS